MREGDVMDHLGEADVRPLVSSLFPFERAFPNRENEVSWGIERTPRNAARHVLEKI